MRSARIVLICAVTLMAGCAAKLRPLEEISSQPLDPAVDAETIVALTAYAAKDRICGDINARYIEQQIADYVATYKPKDGDIIQLGPHGPSDQYAPCINKSSVTACDANADDLRTVHTLLERDPRLSALMSFDQLLVRLRHQCPAQQDLLAQPSALQRWNDRLLSRCGDDRNQPVLIATSVMLSTSEPGGAACTGTFGYLFMSNHCAQLRSAKARRQRRPDSLIWVPPEHGVEVYLCAQIR